MLSLNLLAMLVKKGYRARLSPHRKLFFQLGLVLTLLITYIALEWKTMDRYVQEFNDVSFETEELIDIPLTQRILEIKPPPPPPPAPEKIEIVADEEEIEEIAINAGAEDVVFDSEGAEIITNPEDFSDVREAFENEGFIFASAEVKMIPQTTVSLDTENIK